MFEPAPACRVTDSAPSSALIQASAVAIGGRALLIEGAPGSGKSSLALALIDRGAQLIGDDGASLRREDNQIMAAAPPNIAGKLEIRGVAIVELPIAEPVPVGLILQLDEVGERLPERPATRSILGKDIPVLPFSAGAIAPAQRAEWALEIHGLRAR